MLFVLSPAKSLDFSPAAPGLALTLPRFTDDIAILAESARKLRRSDLKQLMGISDKLADLNHARFQAFDPACENGLQAVIAFNGDVYAGLDARTLDKAALYWAQDHLRILSGLYGVLRPLDALQAYRLEMGVRLKTKRGSTLYDFWGARITETLNADAAGHADPTVVNLASQEYFGAVRKAALKPPLSTCHFKETREGEPPRVASFFAKKARGLMARFAIEGRIDRAEGLKDFTGAGYRYRPDLSTETDWLFTRPHP
jgi:cytoplasmic iron level regulating protein YaaA (DUF328/UPF0246 family)